MNVENINLKYFNLNEFKCKCGCGLLNVDYRLLLMLDTARLLSGVPFIINSCCRCETHNSNVGGSKTSSHLKGLATDIQAKDNVTKYKIVKGLINSGFKRILIYNSFIHTDIDNKKVNPILKIMK